MEWALHRVPLESAAWRDVCRVVAELRALEGVLTAPESTEAFAVEYEELGFGDWTGVEILAKVHEGRTWIIAANTQFDPMKARIGGVEASFEPYEVRVMQV